MYDFSTHSRSKTEQRRVEPAQVRTAFLAPTTTVPHRISIIFLLDTFRLYVVRTCPAATARCASALLHSNSYACTARILTLVAYTLCMPI